MYFADTSWPGRNTQNTFHRLDIWKTLNKIVAICSLHYGGVWYESPGLDFFFNLLGKRVQTMVSQGIPILKNKAQEAIVASKTQDQMAQSEHNAKGEFHLEQTGLIRAVCRLALLSLSVVGTLVLKCNSPFCTFSVQSVWNNGKLCCSLPEQCFHNTMLKEVVHPGICQDDAVGVWGCHAVRIALKHCVKQKKPNW